MASGRSWQEDVMLVVKILVLTSPVWVSVVSFLLHR